MSYTSSTRTQKPAALQRTTSHDQASGAIGNDSHQLLASERPSTDLPNPSSTSSVKHERLKQVAEKEKADYERYQSAERLRLGEELRRHSPQPVGGPSLSLEELDERRRQKERDIKIKEKFESIQKKKKRDEYQREQKRKEQEEIDKKKQIQREKSERLEAQKAVSKEAELQDIRRKRLAYLDSKSST